MGIASLIGGILVLLVWGRALSSPTTRRDKGYCPCCGSKGTVTEDYQGGGFGMNTSSRTQCSECEYYIFSGNGYIRRGEVDIYDKVTGKPLNG